MSKDDSHFQCVEVGQLHRRRRKEVSSTAMSKMNGKTALLSAIYRRIQKVKEAGNQVGRFKGNVGEPFEKRCGAHMGFSERIDTILN